MEVTLEPTESVRPYDQNPRLNDDAVAAVANSLQEFGFRQPIVVDSERVIVCGHTRWKAAKRLELRPPSGDAKVRNVAVEGESVTVHGMTEATDVWSVRKVSPQAMVHLTEKPVELAARAMRLSSRPGENVLDLFGGSGSTLIGAEQTGRRDFLMELDALYCDVIVQRWEHFTGRKATRAVDSGSS